MNHLSIANGSLMEVETLITVAERLGYISEEQERNILSYTAEIGKMLSGLLRSLDPESSILDPAQ